MKKITLLLPVALFATAGYADELELQPAATEAQFQEIAADLGAALSYKHLNPAEPLGIVGFDLSVTGSYMETQDKDTWNAATGEDLDGIASVGIKISKGLPLDFDVSAFASVQPEIETQTLGAAISYASADGGIIAPALAFTAAATVMQGSDDISLSTYSFDVAISKGFTIITPYIGAGYVHTKAEGDRGVLADFEHDEGDEKLYAGFRLSLGMELAAEVEKVGETTGYSLRVGFGF